MKDLKISYYLPEATLTNEALADEWKDWNSKKILRKTGIAKRHIAEQETALSMAVKASRKLFDEYGIAPEQIDFIILITQSPDYRLPTTACMLQNELGIATSAGAFDINLGCSGYIYGLSVAKALITAGMAKNILLVTSETYSKWINKRDKSVRTIFGDAATATYINEPFTGMMKNFVFGTDGSGYDKLIIPAGGTKIRSSLETSKETADPDGYIRNRENLYMDGGAIFNFTMDTVPKLIKQVLVKNDAARNEIDLFILHQANKFMLLNLRDIMEVDPERFYINMEDIGNTVSSTIPIAIKRAAEEGKIRAGGKMILAGFGVGLSWGGVLLEIGKEEKGRR